MKLKSIRLAFICLCIFVLTYVGTVSAATTLINTEEKSSSVQMMENIETIIYGEPSKGGIISRLSTVEEALFGRSLPGTIAERHAAILNFLDVGTEDQPSMLFKLGVAEWVTNKHINASYSALTRLETLETDLEGTVQYDRPIAMRVERLLEGLLMDPVTFTMVNLPKDVPLKLRFLDELSPGTNRVGDNVRLELTDDLIVDYCLVAPAGSLLITEVSEVVKPRMFGIPGEVRLSFKGLKPLGPQYPMVTVGEESKKAIDDARKRGDRGEGAVIGAGAASIAGAALLGPAGLVGGLFVRGNSLKIAAGSVTFVQTSEEMAVAAYPIPTTLRSQTMTSIQGSANTNNNTTQSIQQDYNYDPERDTIIKADVFNRNIPQPSGNTGDSLELPPEQQIDY